MSDDKVRENRMRRMANRQKMGIEKVRRRDPRAWDYGTYHLYDLDKRGAILTNASLDEIEEYLTAS